MELFYPDPDRTDGTVRLRQWRLTDADCLRRASTDPSIPQSTSVPAAFTPEAGHAYIKRVQSHLENGEGVALALTDAVTDKAVGQVWIAVRPQPSVVGLGYWVVPDARLRGYATRAVRLVSAWALGPLGAARIEAWVAPENEPSLRTLASCGFHREGLLRSFLAFGDERTDMTVWSRLPSDEEPFTWSVG